MLFYTTFFLYSIATLWQFSVFLKKRENTRYISNFIFLAVLLHSILLSQWIEIGNHSQNLSTTNIVNTITLIACVGILTVYDKNLNNLFMVVCPLNIIALFIAKYFPGAPLILNTGENPWALYHIWLALLSYSTILIAAIQASLLAYLHHGLTHKSPQLFTRFLPPFTTMEKLFSRCMQSGFVALTIFLLILSKAPGLISWWELIAVAAAWITLVIYFVIRRSRGFSPMLALICIYACLSSLIFVHLYVHT